MEQQCLRKKEDKEINQSEASYLQEHLIGPAGRGTASAVIDRFYLLTTRPYSGLAS